MMDSLEPRKNNEPKNPPLFPNVGDVNPVFAETAKRLQFLVGYFLLMLVLGMIGAMFWYLVNAQSTILGGLILSILIANAIKGWAREKVNEALKIVDIKK